VPPVSRAIVCSATGSKSLLRIAIGYTATSARRAAATAASSDETLDTSRPSVNRTITRPGLLVPRSNFAEVATASYSAVP
jgi:hypothetical protein